MNKTLQNIIMYFKFIFAYDFDFCQVKKYASIFKYISKSVYVYVGLHASVEKFIQSSLNVVILRVSIQKWVPWSSADPLCS